MRLKRSMFLLVFAVSCLMAAATTSFTAVRGVWANDNAEAVITDSVCIFFAKSNSNMFAVLEIPSAGIYHRTVFEKDGSVSSDTFPTPLEIKTADGVIEICGERLKKIEVIDIAAPYDMTECKYRLDVGKCLQEWRLGTKYGIQNNMPYCEINTNRHMFVYLVNPAMVYIRAAATRNNNGGTLFFQNIRMMKNRNTGEFTMNIVPQNFNTAKNDLEIDLSKFNPKACTFSPDGGIYWSLISFAPDQILLNGCGETYQVSRPTKDAPINEWIKYNPYSGADFSVELMKQAFQ